jgi:hypothetical protein
LRRKYVAGFLQALAIVCALLFRTCLTGELEGMVKKAVKKTMELFRAPDRWLCNRRLRRKINRVGEQPDFGTDQVLLFHVPEALITPYLVTLCILGKTLKELGHRVVFTRCFDCYALCPAKSHVAGERENKLSCEHCFRNSLEMLEKYGLEFLDIRTFMNDDIQHKVNKAVAEAPSDLRRFEVDGVRFGELSAVDVVLRSKVSDFENVDAATRQMWLKYIQTCLTSYWIMSEMLRCLKVERLLYFNDYSIHLAARVMAARNGVECLTVGVDSHLNQDYRRIQITPKTWKTMSYLQAGAWPEWRDLALSPERVENVGDDLICRLEAAGSHRYSPPKTLGGLDVFDTFGFNPDQKLLVAYTSSLDEMIAARMTLSSVGEDIEDRCQPFPDQIEWLRELIRYVETQNDVLQLVVRIHPREGVSCVDSVMSDHLHRLRSAFSNPYKNVRIVWPEDKISSYDLAECADLILTSWSTMGVELARMACPVLTSTSGVSAFPHDDFMEWGETQKEYLEKLNDLLEQQVTIGQVVRAFRWYSMFHMGMSVSIGDVLESHESPHELPKFHMPARAGELEALVFGKTSVLDINRGYLIRSQNATADSREEASVTRQLRRIAQYIITGIDSKDDYELAFRQEQGSLTGQPSEDWNSDRTKDVVISGRTIRYRSGNRLVNRHSPMLVRLIRLGGQECSEGTKL